MTYNTVPVKAFMYFCAGIKNNKIQKNLKIRHEGRCGRCNRKLTTPDSIDSCFGPECIKFV